MTTPIGRTSAPAVRSSLSPTAAVQQEMQTYMQRWQFAPGTGPFKSAPAMKLYEKNAEIVDLVPNMDKALKGDFSRTYKGAAPYEKAMDSLYGKLDSFTMIPLKQTLTLQKDGTVKAESVFLAQMGFAHAGKAIVGPPPIPVRATVEWRQQSDGSWKISKEKLNPLGVDEGEALSKKLKSGFEDVATKVRDTLHDTFDPTHFSL